MRLVSVVGMFLTTKTRWEKAHYYLGKHYNKILDLEKVKPMGKEAQI
jgi:serine/threonine-protein kinase ATR